jgi:hypothetical protein
MISDNRRNSDGSPPSARKATVKIDRALVENAVAKTKAASKGPLRPSPAILTSVNKPVLKITPRTTVVVQTSADEPKSSATIAEGPAVKRKTVSLDHKLPAQSDANTDVGPPGLRADHACNAEATVSSLHAEALSDASTGVLKTRSLTASPSVPLSATLPDGSLAAVLHSLLREHGPLVYQNRKAFCGFMADGLAGRLGEYRQAVSALGLLVEEGFPARLGEATAQTIDSVIRQEERRVASEHPIRPELLAEACACWQAALRPDLLHAVLNRSKDPAGVSEDSQRVCALSPASRLDRTPPGNIRTSVAQSTSLPQSIPPIKPFLVPGSASSDEPYFPPVSHSAAQMWPPPRRFRWKLAALVIGLLFLIVWPLIIGYGPRTTSAPAPSNLQRGEQQTNGGNKQQNSAEHVSAQRTTSIPVKIITMPSEKEKRVNDGRLFVNEGEPSPRLLFRLYDGPPNSPQSNVTQFDWQRSINAQGNWFDRKEHRSGIWRIHAVNPSYGILLAGEKIDSTGFSVAFEIQQIVPGSQKPMRRPIKYVSWYENGQEYKQEGAILESENSGSSIFFEVSYLDMNYSNPLRWVQFDIESGESAGRVFAGRNSRGTWKILRNRPYPNVFLIGESIDSKGVKRQFRIENQQSR